MAKAARLFLCVLLLAGVSLAQEGTPKAEIFGGYSYMRFQPRFSVLGIDVTPDSANLNGWNASLTGNFNRFFGITADFAGHYGSPTIGFGGIGLPGSLASADVSNYTFLFGPQVGLRTGKLRPFAHALFGAGHIKVSPNVLGFSLGSLGLSDSDTSWAMALGGGVDYALGDTFSVRFAQLDWTRTNFFDTNQNHFRYSGGIVLNLGRH
ncbi:MAG: outer membrane beta-barrel protein [Terriglobales bacterium]